jgi:hypothetical protein
LVLSVGLRTACSPFAAASLTTETDCANAGDNVGNKSFASGFPRAGFGVILSVRIGQAVTMPSGIRSVLRHGCHDWFVAHRLVQHEAFERIELAAPGRAF